MILTDAFSRLLWAAAIIVGGVTLWFSLNRWLLFRAGQNDLTSSAHSGPAIMYFTTPSCAPCKSFQRPALERVKQALDGKLKIVEIDASAQPELANQWGVLSVPTTFILDAHGKPRHVNHGPTSAEKLLRQLGSI